MGVSQIDKGTIRSDALRRLSKLTLENSPLLSSYSEEIHDSFSRLLQMVPKGVKTEETLSKVAISLKEYEVLIALCESTEGNLKSSDQVALLVEKLKLYLLELPNQKFSPSIFDRTESSTPWSTLAESLTTALINLSSKFEFKYQSMILEIFQEFNGLLSEKNNFELSNYLTLIGYIDGLRKNSTILTISPQSFSIFVTLDKLVDDVDFLNEVETYSNSVYLNLEYNAILDRDIVVDLSPVLFIERLCALMSSIISSILGSPEDTLMQYLLKRVSQRFDDDSNQSIEVSNSGLELIEILTEKCVQKLEFLDRGETYIVYSTYNRLKYGYSAKSHILQVIGCGMYTNNINIKIAKRTFKNALEIRDLMLDSDLGLSVIQLGALLVFKDEQVGAILTRAFTSLVSNPKFLYCQKASYCVGLASKVLSQDAVVTTIYALTNLLFVGNDGLQLGSRNGTKKNTGLLKLDSTSSRDLSASRKNSNNFSDGQSSKALQYDESESSKVTENAITAIIEISQACNDETISTLAVTILSQKTVRLESSVGKLLLRGLVSCAPTLPDREFLILVRLLNKLSLDAFEDNNNQLLENLIDARVDLSHKIDKDNELFPVYLREVLNVIVSKGDVEILEHHRSHTEIRQIGDQIGIFLKPLAELLPDVYNGEKPLELKDKEIVNLFRNIWFNMVVHGYFINSSNAKKYSKELERIAYNTPPLASESSWDRTETSLELNTVLRRGSSNHNVKDHKAIMEEIFEVHRTMSYPKLMFLSATVFLESLRVKSGDASTILQYFSDPSLKISGVDKYISLIAFKISKNFVFFINRGADKQFSADILAEQLTNMLTLCCHIVEELQDAAIQCCDLLINKIPSSLCHSKSLFALFDILTLLFNSLVDADINQYEPTTSFHAQITGIRLLLSDSYQWRKDTFDMFHSKAKNWVQLILLKSNVDVKSLIQSYVSNIGGFQSANKIQFGTSFAMNMSGKISANDRELSSISNLSNLEFNTLPAFVSQLNWRSNDLVEKALIKNFNDVDGTFRKIRARVNTLKLEVNENAHYSTDDVTTLLSDISGLTLFSNENTAEMIRYLVEIPFIVFESSIITTVIGFWLTVMKERPETSILLLSEIAKEWEKSIEQQRGLFSRAYDIKNPEYFKQEYSPSDRKAVNRLAHRTSKSFEIHLQIIRLFASNFEATLNQSDHLLKIFTRFVEVGLRNLSTASLHPFARLVRFELIRFSYDVLNYHVKFSSRSVVSLTELILDASLSWFKRRGVYPYGSNVLKVKADLVLLNEVARLLSHTSTFSLESLASKKEILLLFLEDELFKISVWLNPLNPVDTRGKLIKQQISEANITSAYSIDPILAVNLALRYKHKNLDDLLQKLIINNPLPAVSYPDAINYLIRTSSGSPNPSYHLLFWEPLSPIDAIALFLPPFGNNPYILQYIMRSLEFHDVNITFFYVPQIVQSLRFDAKGYVERFIIETAKVSQLFAHQIIWNMLANSYKDEDSTEPDSLKPVLDRIQGKMTKTFSKKDYDFYRKEFSFFNEVTGISGKLKPYIKKTKAEKKVKIDEEMAKIKVESDVYLPSNPDGVIVDINRKSGKPLQSHAKAPFLATFKIKKEVEDVNENGEIVRTEVEKWQSAIFKVGDDCRQDVLALQLISVFRTIWSSAGLDLYVYPYRVTATAPGCGVIDVLPNSISRDMLGREAVNGLYEYYTSKFGPENSIEFQHARNNLIKSLAAYSIISYLLQFKDRHNGNIMYDDQGHILHIDFGFCFDIVPGGVKFEVAPFKLTHEMIMVLGGSNNTQAFKWFEELCVKGYLACRPYMETIVSCVTPMLESGLPCFKDSTIKKLRSRFVPSKSEKDASLYMRSLIRKSQTSFSTKGYDEFQKLTNGIPY